MEIIALTISIVALVVSAAIAIYSWQKSRAIYDVQRMKFAFDPGLSRTDDEVRHDEEFRKLLHTGKWTIITSYDLGKKDKEHYNCFVLGKVKK